MTGRRRRRAPPDDDPPHVPGRLLDWRDSSHWSPRERPCRYCNWPTHLRDSQRRPAHKTCAETALDRQAAEAADTYQNGQP